MERRSPTSTLTIVTCISVVAVFQMVYLHLKVMYLDHEQRLMVDVQQNIKKELRSLATMMRLCGNTGRGETIPGSRGSRNSNAIDDGHKRKIRSILTKVTTGTSKLGLNATETLGKQRGKDPKNKIMTFMPIIFEDINRTINVVKSLNNIEHYDKLNKYVEKQLVNGPVEAKKILQLELSSHHKNISREVNIDECSSPVKGLSVNIDVNVDSRGNCHCVATKNESKDYAKSSADPPPHPRVFLPASRIKGTVGFPLEIRCNVTGAHGSTVRWMKDSQETSEDQFFTADNRSIILRISSPSMKDNGNYSCNIENEIGVDHKTVQVTFIDKDCSAWKQKGYMETGTYTVSPDGGPSFDIYCDMETNGGGWNVIQRREDGSVDFYRDWVAYKYGFGNIRGEFWLGNEKIHRLTTSMAMSIRFDLVDSDGKESFSEYEFFEVGQEKDEYRLHVHSYSGNAGDSFLYHDGMKFSTKNKGYIIFGARCAERFRGAWWYRSCHRSNLNGEYVVGRSISSAGGIKWMSFNSNRGSLVKTEMKIRPFNGRKEKILSSRRYR